LFCPPYLPPLAASSLFSCPVASHSFFYVLSLHDALPISFLMMHLSAIRKQRVTIVVLCLLLIGTIIISISTGYANINYKHRTTKIGRAHAELQSRFDLVCRLLLEKKNPIHNKQNTTRIYK